MIDPDKIRFIHGMDQIEADLKSFFLEQASVERSERMIQAIMTTDAKAADNIRELDDEDLVCVGWMAAVWLRSLLEQKCEEE